MIASFASSSAAMAARSWSGCSYSAGSLGGHQRMVCGQRTPSSSTRRTELPTRRAPAEYPDRYSSEATAGAERRLTSTTRNFAVHDPQKQPLDAHGAIGAPEEAALAGDDVQMLE